MLLLLATWAAVSGCSIYDGTTRAGAGSGDVPDAPLARDVEAPDAPRAADALLPESDAEVSVDVDGSGDRSTALDGSGDVITEFEAGVDRIADVGGGSDGITDVEGGGDGSSGAADTSHDSVADVDGTSGDRMADVGAPEIGGEAGGGEAGGGEAGDVRGEVIADAVDEAASDTRDDRPPTAGFSVQYKAVETNASANAIRSELTILDAGPSSVPLEELSLRYYFTSEITEPWAIDIGFTGLNPGFLDLAQFAIKNVVRMATPTPTADTYVELSYRAGTPSIGPGQSVIIAWQFHSSSFAVLEQTNDYSFDASKVNAADWDRVVLMRSGSAIWGIPP